MHGNYLVIARFNLFRKLIVYSNYAGGGGRGRAEVLKNHIYIPQVEVKTNKSRVERDKPDKSKH